MIKAVNDMSPHLAVVNLTLLRIKGVFVNLFVTAKDMLEL
jgi:hypothetical protein